jgi:hypothetical protein
MILDAIRGGEVRDGTPESTDETPTIAPACCRFLRR